MHIPHYIKLFIKKGHAWLNDKMLVTLAEVETDVTLSEAETNVTLSEGETNVTLRRSTESHGSTTLTMTTTAG